MDAPLVLLLLLLLLQVPRSQAGVSVFTSEPNVTALRDSNVLLPCRFSLEQYPIKVSRLNVTWSHYGFVVAKFESGKVKTRQHASMFEKDVPQGNASLLLESIVKRDEGRYKCEVNYEGDKESVSLVLTIQVPPEVLLLPELVHLLTEHRLTCSAKNFYPKNISFIWTMNGQVVSAMGTTEPHLNPDGTYNSESVYCFTPFSRRTLTCEVQHEALKEPLRRSVTYSGLTLEEVTRIAVTIIIIIFLTLFILWWSSVSLFPLILLKDVNGVPWALECTLMGWRLELVTVEWIKNDQQIFLDKEFTDVEVGDEEAPRDSSEYSKKRFSIKDLCVERNILRLEMKATDKELEEEKFKCHVKHRLTGRCLECSFEI
ncbi:CD276 antigen-like [Polypterus senegalus]|uniref:CD276 antigen-like n=1 Tax=Polypterus senegalus TaxID=55291 RepID=UPI001964AD30|nr:CD276 antigen-like [Polypterus senegalus]